MELLISVHEGKLYKIRTTASTLQLSAGRGCYPSLPVAVAKVVQTTAVCHLAECVSGGASGPSTHNPPSAGYCPIDDRNTFERLDYHTKTDMDWANGASSTGFRPRPMRLLLPRSRSRDDVDSSGGPDRALTLFRCRAPPCAFSSRPCPRPHFCLRPSRRTPNSVSPSPQSEAIRATMCNFTRL